MPRRRWAAAELALISSLLALLCCQREPRERSAQRGQGNAAVPAVVEQGGTPSASLPWFRDVSHEMGIVFAQSHAGKSPLNILETVGTGCGFVDIDNDGWLDLLLMAEHRLALYHNVKGQRFEEVTPASWKDPSYWWGGCATGDYDNDGWTDLYLSGYRCSWLLHNEKGVLREVSEQAGVRNRDRWESSALFVDVDGDGRLDLYVGAYLKFGKGWREFCPVAEGLLSACPPTFYDGEIGRLYRNRGDGRFEEVTEQAGLRQTRGKTLAVSTTDLEPDGDADLYLANDGVACDLFRNDGKGRFTNDGVISGTAFNAQGLPQAGMGCDWGDVNSDGLLDLVVGTFQHQPVSLYRNDGNGLFTEMSSQAGLYEPTLLRLTFGAKLLDVQNDGHLDLVLTNGHIQDNIHLVDDSAHYRQPPQLFLNRGDSSFVLADPQAAGSSFAQPMVGRGVAAGDYDNDGDLDLVWMDLEGSAHLLRNQRGQESSYLQVRLLDRHGRDALGARVWAEVNGARRLRVCTTSGSYLSAHDPRVHFGLGQIEQVDRLIVEWPGGRRTVQQQVAANQLLTLREPDR